MPIAGVVEEHYLITFRRMQLGLDPDVARDQTAGSPSQRTTAQTAMTLPQLQKNQRETISPRTQVLISAKQATWIVDQANLKRKRVSSFGRMQSDQELLSLLDRDRQKKKTRRLLPVVPTNP